MINGAVFFDRDGIVNKRIVGDYVKSINEFKIIPAFFDTLRIVHELGMQAYLITNQQGIGKGLMSESDLTTIHDYMNNELIKYTGKPFDGIYFCPSLDEANDFRRKPNPGMIIEAIVEHSLDKSKCTFIGDSVNDVFAGKRAGIQTILIHKKPEINSNPDYKFQSMKELNGHLLRILTGLIR